MWQSYADRVRQEQCKRSREEMQIQEARNNLSHLEHSWNTNNILWNSKASVTGAPVWYFYSFSSSPSFPRPIAEEHNLCLENELFCGGILTPVQLFHLEFQPSAWALAFSDLSIFKSLLWQAFCSWVALSGLNRIQPKVNWGSHRDNA